MSNMQIRFYSDWLADPAKEISQDEARRMDMYSRAFFTGAGELAWIELYRKGELSDVEYHCSDIRSIRAGHLSRYPNIKFTTFHKAQGSNGFRWALTVRYAANGVYDAHMVHLYDSNDLEIMNLGYTVRGGVLIAITKFLHQTPDEIALMFEYDKDGVPVGVYDPEEGESVPLNEILHALPDPEFYADGFTLPRELRGSSTSILSAADISRDEWPDTQ